MVRSPRSIAFGLFVVALASIGYWGVRDISRGTALEMGPGYLPILICGVLAVLGAIKLIEGFLVDGAPLEPVVWKPVIATMVSIAVFGYAVEPFGLVVATVSLVLIATLGTADRNWLSTLLFACLLAAGCVVVFVYLLRSPFTIWPA